MIYGLEQGGNETRNAPTEITMVLELSEALAQRCLAATGVGEVEGKKFDKPIPFVPGVRVRILAKPGEIYDRSRHGSDQDQRVVRRGKRALEFVGTHEGISKLIKEAKYPQAQQRRTIFPRQIQS